MLHADPDAVAQMVAERWDVPGPLKLAGLPIGATADVWTVTDAAGRRYVAKLIYDAQHSAEQGLAVAEVVERRTGLPTGAPIRTRDGALTAMTPSVHGLEHPLALLSFVDGVPIWPGDGLQPEAAADLLAHVHTVAPKLTVDVAPFDSRLDYVDDHEDIAYAELIRPALSDAARRTRDLLDTHALTQGVCYGDGPEARQLADGALGLVDWGGVTRGPLLWDVVTWARSFPEPEQARFLTRYADMGSLPPEELAQVDTFDRMRIAWLLRFRAYRVARADHYDETAADDARKVAEYAAQLGVDLL